MAPTQPQSWLVHVGGRVVDWLTERPEMVAVLGFVAAAVIVAVHAARAAVWQWRHRRLSTHAHQILITPPAEVDPAGATAWWANLHDLLSPSRRHRLLHGTPHIAMEYRWAGRQLTIVAWVPGTVPAGPVAAAVRAAWPGAACTVQKATAPIPTDTRTTSKPAGSQVGSPAGSQAVGGALAPAMPGWYPLNVDQATDPMRPIVAGAGLHSTEHACVQVLARPATPRQVARLRAGAAALRTGKPPTSGLLDPTPLVRGALNLTTEIVTELVTPGPPRRTGTAAGAESRRGQPDPLRDRDVGPAIDKTIGPQWETAIRYAVANTATRGGGDSTGSSVDGSDSVARRLTTLAHGIASAFGGYAGRNRLRHLPVAHPVDVLTRRPLRRGFLLSAQELAVIAGLPTDLAVPGLGRARAKSVPAPIDVPAGGRNTKILGTAEVGGHSVALPIADARQHIHLIGSTGSGKSTEMCHLVLDDIKARRGVVVIDPKGDLVLDILDRIPASVADRVVLIDPDQPGGATFNPLQGLDDDLIVDNVVSIFSKIFQRHWGPRIDDVLRVACLTLMRKANATLTLVPPLLQGHRFRAAFTADLNDPEGLLGFWEWYESIPPPLRAQIIAPVLSRLRAFLLRDFVKATLGVPRSSFDMGHVLDHGGILLARLPKGQIGEETAKLMGSFVFASVWQAATARARIPEPDRRDASIYVDEAHNVLNLAGSVGDMLAEARGYHLSLTLAHQNLTQLPRETQLALSANARTKIFFSCSPEDAHQLARHTLPELDEHDLSHLDAYTAAARLVVASRETAAFTLRTRPPTPIVGEALAIRQQVAHTERSEPTGIEQLARRSRTRVDSGHGTDPDRTDQNRTDKNRRTNQDRRNKPDRRDQIRRDDLDRGENGRG
ncbi:type IV secretory system conjugative DNA transfer family protein [Virgisporangium aurantiacum]|nr:type IV secretion system DNA-binding domain-containing protein [Virgisporangium aurantiacum]